MKGLLVGAMVVLFLTSFAFLSQGYDKLTNYNNPEESYLSTEEPVNAYVGGDAYNYIINGTHATAYFVLAGFLFLSAIACGVWREIIVFREQQTSSNVITTEHDIPVE